MTNARHDLSMLVGFALFQAWVTLCFFTTQIFPDASGADWHVYEKSLLVSVVALVPCAICHERVAPLLRKPASRWALAACAALGTLIIPFSLRPDVTGIALAWAAALLTGIASGLLNLAWCQEFAEHGNPFDFALSVVTSSVIIYVLTNLVYTPAVSPWALLAISIALALVTCALLARPRSATSAYVQLATPLVVRPKRIFVARLCVGIFVVSFADELLRNLYLGGTDLSFYASDINLVVLLLKVIVSTLVVSDIRQGRRDDFSFLFRASFLLALIAALLLPYAHETASVAYAVTNCGAFLFKLTVMLATLELCARHGAPAVLVFAIVRAVRSLDLLIGSSAFALVSTLRDGAPVTQDQAGAISIAIAVLVAVAYLFVFATEAGPLARLRGNPDDEAEPVDVETGGTPAEGELESTSEVARDIDALCGELADRGQLSAREIDVLRLLARGRTTVRIEAELGISSNTVNTHVKHVFQKLGVHSRQELLDLLERAANGQLDGHPAGLR